MRKPKVLIVEDSAPLRKLLTDALGEIYDVRAAVDGVAGLQTILEWYPDLVITDLMMPNMDGERMVAMMRERKDLDHVPVIVLTAKEETHACVRLLSQGAQDYVKKPFHIEEIYVRVRNLVEAQQARDVLVAQLDDRSVGLQHAARMLAAQDAALRDAVTTAIRERDRAEQATRAYANFLRIMSHELRTPVTAMQLFIKLLEEDDDEPLSPRHSDRVEKVARANMRLLHMVDTILHFARIEGGRYEPRAIEIDLKFLLEDVLSAQATYLDRKGIQIDVSSEGDTELWTDARVLRSVVTSVVDMVMNFLSDSTAHAEVKVGDGQGRIMISNDTLRIADPDLEEIFEPLHAQHDVKVRSGFGSGVGLTIARDLVRALGGDLGVYSSEAGTCFWIDVPNLQKIENNHIHSGEGRHERLETA